MDYLECYRKLDLYLREGIVEFQGTEYQDIINNLIDHAEKISMDSTCCKIRKSALLFTTTGVLSGRANMNLIKTCDGVCRIDTMCKTRLNDCDMCTTTDPLLSTMLYCRDCRNIVNSNVLIYAFDKEKQRIVSDITPSREAIREAAMMGVSNLLTVNEDRTVTIIPLSKRDGDTCTYSEYVYKNI